MLRTTLYLLLKCPLIHFQSHRFQSSIIVYERKIRKIYRKFNFKTMASSSIDIKPPNILVYSGEKAFQNIATSLLKCLHVDKYIAYHLKQNQVLTTPWMDNVALLVIFSNEFTENIAKEFIHYVKKGGKLLVIGSKFSVTGICLSKIINEDFVSVKYKNDISVLNQGKYAYSIEKGLALATDDKNSPLIIKVPVENGIIIISSVYLGLDLSEISSVTDKEKLTAIKNSYDCSLPILKSLLTEEFGLEGHVSELPTPTPGYVFIDKNYQLENKMKLLSISEISLEKSVKTLDVSQSSGLKVPLLFEHKDLKIDFFDKDCYFSSLKTSYFGKTVVFFPVVTSTMYPAAHLSDYPGLVVMAGRQVLGKGRGDNLWISPEGAAAFTLHFPLMLSSKLGRKMSLMQHMASLAVVHGLRKRPGLENLDFQLKWPNDIFYEKNKKIGGVLVNTTVQGDVVHVFVGIGINVSNKRPTVCINSVISDYNAKNQKSLPLIKIEEVIAATLNELEDLTKDFTESAREKFLELYYNYWIHQDQSITLSSSDEKAVVKGIDEYGFLVVETEKGRKLSLQPDGNRFDIMKNLIISKEL